MKGLPNPLILNNLQKDGCPSAVPFTFPEVVINGLTRERAFKVAPLAARVVQLEDGIEDAAQAMRTFSASFNEYLHNLPQGIGQSGEALTPEREFDFNHGN